MIYADYNASAPLLPVVKDHLKQRLESDLFANPNTIHSLGQRIAGGMEKCRRVIAEVVGCHPDQICFNSGASEAITTVLHSVLSKADQSRRLVITSPIEHSVVLNALEAYRAMGVTTELVRVNSHGVVDLQHLRELVIKHKDRIALVTIMAANNETGVIQPFSEIGEICRQQGLTYLSDTTQLIGKGEFTFLSTGMDYAVCSGHKVGALPGIGFLISRDPTLLNPMVFGGGQEKGLRGGTQNYLGIETLAIALSDYQANAGKLAALALAREQFEQEILNTFPEVRVIGNGAPRLAGTTLIGYPGIHGQAVQIELEAHDIFVSTSSACSDNEPATSKVLRAMGIDDGLGRSVIRISLSYSHGQKEYSALAQALKAAYNKLRKIHSF
jgi:cysteine desulfurase